MLKAGQCVSVLRWYRDWRRISHRQCCGCRMHGGPRERVLSMSRRTASLMVLQSKRARSSVSLSLVSFTHFRLETPPAPLMLISSLATNTMIDLAFVLSYFVCLVCLWIFGLNHLNAVWRITLGLGVVPPLFLLYFRLKMHEVNQLIIP